MAILAHTRVLPETKPAIEVSLRLSSVTQSAHDVSNFLQPCVWYNFDVVRRIRIEA